ncbi:Zn-ribbon domain-containing OB-fold protein [Alkalilacustris brevis]|uniref:Zn-ribbon domain-containing OB-fold protein n=1 Tax=Alkalilacustris brevis TaxID=2026338 RepID=UPI000E0D7DD1|nr:OB-fold domain-containing protein [Alkalilacustris brevis]
MTRPMPEITDINRPYWDGLAQGELRFQRCDGCGHAWLPARTHCPQCLGARAQWQVASGRGQIVSWVVYHRAYAPHLQDQIPYNVAIVALEEGPRMLTNITDSATGEGFAIGAPVELTIEEEDGLHLPRFRLRA